MTHVNWNAFMPLLCVLFGKYYIVVFQCTPLHFFRGFRQFLMRTRIIRGKLIIVDTHTHTPWVLWSKKRNNNNTNTYTSTQTHRYDDRADRSFHRAFATLRILFEIPFHIKWFFSAQKFTPFSCSCVRSGNGNDFDRSIFGGAVFDWKIRTWMLLSHAKRGHNEHSAAGARLRERRINGKLWKKCVSLSECNQSTRLRALNWL